jgi:predicted nucleic acid-binding protein
MIVCDTGPLVAAAISDDARNRECVDLLTSLHLARRKLLVPGTVAAEVGYMLARDGGPDSEARFLDSMADGTFSPIDLKVEDYRRASELVTTYRDLGLGTTERHGHRPVRATRPHRGCDSRPPSFLGRPATSRRCPRPSARVTTFNPLLVVLLDIRADRPRTSPPRDAHKSGQSRVSEADIRASVLFRDEEAVGSNPATPTNENGPSSDAGRAVFVAAHTKVLQ